MNELIKHAFTWTHSELQRFKKDDSLGTVTSRIEQKLEAANHLLQNVLMCQFSDAPDLYCTAVLNVYGAFSYPKEDVFTTKYSLHVHFRQQADMLAVLKKLLTGQHVQGESVKVLASYAHKYSYTLDHKDDDSMRNVVTKALDDLAKGVWESYCKGHATSEETSGVWFDSTKAAFQAALDNLCYTLEAIPRYLLNDDFNFDTTPVIRVTPHEFNSLTVELRTARPDVPNLRARIDYEIIPYNFSSLQAAEYVLTRRILQWYKDGMPAGATRDLCTERFYDSFTTRRTLIKAEARVDSCYTAGYQRLVSNDAPTTESERGSNDTPVVQGSGDNPVQSGEGMHTDGNSDADGHTPHGGDTAERSDTCTDGDSVRKDTNELHEQSSCTCSGGACEQGSSASSLRIEPVICAGECKYPVTIEQPGSAGGNAEKTAGDEQTESVADGVTAAMTALAKQWPGGKAVAEVIPGDEPGDIKIAVTVTPKSTKEKVVLYEDSTEEQQLTWLRDMFEAQLADIVRNSISRRPNFYLQPRMRLDYTPERTTVYVTIWAEGYADTRVTATLVEEETFRVDYKLTTSCYAAAMRALCAKVTAWLRGHNCKPLEKSPWASDKPDRVKVAEGTFCPHLDMSQRLGGLVGNVGK